MAESASTSDDSICKLCNKRPRLYTCPRCLKGYCNFKCYVSEVHRSCSENFYKQWVEGELKSQKNDLESKRKIRNILKRAYETHFKNALDEKEDMANISYLIDSDDDEEIPDLKVRLNKVNLDEPQSIWAILTDAEKQEFDSVLKNGEALIKLLPEWTPWWTYRVEKKLIQSMEEDTTNIYNNLKYPTLMDVPLFNKSQKTSPCVYFNVINVIYAYACVALCYNGDYSDLPVDAANLFVMLSQNIKNNQVFQDADSAIESVIQRGKEIGWLSMYDRTLNIVREAGAAILQGPSAEMRTLYISAALSELHRLLTTIRKNAKQKESQNKKSKDNQKKSICNSQEFDNYGLNLSKRNVYQYLKKLEYYLSWVKTFWIEFA